VSTGVLAAIGAAARKAADDRERLHGDAVRAAAEQRAPRGADFRAGLAAPGASIIAECKRRSPSRGILRHPYDPAVIAAGYQAAGAAAISVLTEPAFFDGALEHLAAVRERVSVPLLRKDFVSTRFQIAETRACGADAVLLIVDSLSGEQLVDLIAAAGRHGLAALVEVHTREELARAVDAGADLVGVNSRNLRTLEVQLEIFDDLIEAIPDDVIAVAESGLRTARDISRLSNAGYDAFLIGEHFMTSPDPGASLAQLLASADGGAGR